MRMITFSFAILAFALPVCAGEVANRFASSTLKDWKTMSAAQRRAIAEDLTKDVPEKDRRVSVEKLAANINECLDHLAADPKYESFALGKAYPECVVPAARDFQ